MTGHKIINESGMCDLKFPYVFISSLTFGLLIESVCLDFIRKIAPLIFDVKFHMFISKTFMLGLHGNLVLYVFYTTPLK